MRASLFRSLPVLALSAAVTLVPTQARAIG